MRKKIVWLVVGFLMAISLVMASCAPAVTEDEEVAPPPEKEEVVTEEEEVVTEEEVTLGPEVPKYGGVFNQVWNRNVAFFDEVRGLSYFGYTIPLTNEELLIGDWSKGPAGTGEASFIYYMYLPENLRKGHLAESMEWPDPQTIVYHIRKGVRFHDKPPANGRELTADDVVFSIERLGQTQWAAVYAQRIESITAPDKWTVVIKCKPGWLGSAYLMTAWNVHIVPRDVVEAYGDMTDWKVSSGTGPYMLVDYVSGSSATFIRNPNYWGKDPLHPENTLPYLDGVKYLIIPDGSTQLAAMRTGKIDWLGGLRVELPWEDAQSLMRTNPELKYQEHLSENYEALFGRVDTKPFDDIRVRKALFMAIDRQELKNTYFSGRAELFAWPVMPIPEFDDLFIPFDELPESTREIYEYDPDKAVQLLAEAGYPDGFQTEIVCYATQADLLSIIKEYWADIGVDLEIDVKEFAAWNSLGVGKKFEQMILGKVTPGMPLSMYRLVAGAAYNWGLIDDPKINEAYEEISKSYMDQAHQRQVFKDLVPYIVDQFYIIQLPDPYFYTFWQPWVQNYHGEISLGFLGEYTIFTYYTWIDQNLKEEITGRR